MVSDVIGDCLIKQVASVLHDPENAADALFLLFRIRLVDKSWHRHVMHSATNFWHSLTSRFKISVDENPSCTLCSWELSDSDNEYNSEFIIELRSLSPPSREEIAISLTDFILEWDGDQWDRAEILANLESDEDDI